MDKFIIIGDSTNEVGSLISVSELDFIKFVSLKKLQFIYKTGFYFEIELGVDAALGTEYYNLFADAVTAALQQPWTNPVPTIFGKNAAGEYDGVLNILDSAGDPCVIKTVTYTI